MPRYFGHCPKDSIIQGGLADFGGKVLRDHSDRRNHLSSFLEIFDTHEPIVAASPATARLPGDEVHRPRLRTSTCARPQGYYCRVGTDLRGAWKVSCCQEANVPLAGLASQSRPDGLLRLPVLHIADVSLCPLLVRS